MSEQAKASPSPSQLPPDPGRGEFETLIRWMGVVGFAVFALWSAWEFMTYQRGPVPRYFLDPRAYPNSILVQFSIGEYLETFGPWRGLGWMNWMDLGFLGMLLFLALVLWADSLLFSLILGWLLLTGSLFLMMATFLPTTLAWVVFWILLFGFLVPVSNAKSRRRRRRLARDRNLHLPRPLVGSLGVAALLVLAVLSAATPAIQSDGLRYHLAAASIWQDRGAMAPIEGMAFSHFPFLVEMPFGDGEFVAKLFHFLLFLVALAAVMGLTRQCAKWSLTPARSRHSLEFIALALAATIPTFTVVSTWAFTDAGVVCFLLAAFFTHALWWHTGSMRHLILAAVLTGFYLGTKYTALVPAFALGVGVLAHGASHSPIQRLRNGLIFGVIALAIGSPWYIRNWVQTGNPVFPLANEAFHAPGWDAECQALWEEKAAQKGVGYDLSLMGAAWRGATFLWRGGEGIGPGGFEDQSIGLTPWLLAPLGLAGLLLIAFRRGGWWWFYLAFIAVNWWLWFSTYQSNRLLLSTLIVALPGCVVGLRQLTLQWRGLWVAALIALGTASVYQGLWIARYFMTESYPLQLALGFWDPDEWRSAKLNYFDGARALEEIVPAGERTLVIGESRRYYFPPNVVMSDWFDPPAVRRFLAGTSTPEEVTAALAEDGITHIFLNLPELFPLWQLYPHLLREDHTIDVGEYWQLWLRNAAPEGSNLWYLRRRFTDDQAALLAAWLGSVPHSVVWQGDQPSTLGVEVWELDSATN